MSPSASEHNANSDERPRLAGDLGRSSCRPDSLRKEDEPARHCNVYGRELTDEEIAAGTHRELVGGLWEELGVLQLEFLRREGLRPDSRLLDLGCGCLRAGIHFVRFLEPGHYYGLDINASLVRAGLEVELPRAGFAGLLPPENLLVNDRFEAWRFGVAFDFALAQSLFTHLPAGEIRRCLVELTRCLEPGARLYATFFECLAPVGEPSTPVVQEPGGVRTYSDRDPFHYPLSEILELAAGLPWEPVYYGSWGHPRGQRMLRFDRVQG